MRYVISHVVVVFSLILLVIIIASNDLDYKMNTNVMYMKSTVDIGINEAYWSNNLYSKDFFWQVHCSNSYISCLNSLLFSCRPLFLHKHGQHT